jgi:thiol-disulfide isomerase/thioredoxin
VTSRRTLVIAAVLVVVLAAVVAAVAAGGGDDDVDLASELGAPSVAGAALAPLEEGVPDPALGQPAPTATEGGTTVGEPGQLVAFVAHWCPHCRAEVPRLVEWIDAGDIPADAIKLVSTSVDEKAPNYPPSAWLEDEAWPGEVLLDSAAGDVARAFGVSGFPFFVAIDGEGRVAARASGELTLQQVEALLATVG